MIVLDGVTKRFGRHGEVLALDNVSLTVEEGAFVLLTGPSGAGKTTLLKLIFAAERPDEGRVLLFGRDIGKLRRSSVPYLRRNVGVVFQDFKLLPDRSALENVAMALEIRALPRRVMRDRAADALASVGLAWKLEVAPSRLSAGEQQRVAIARALVGEPAILLADEPTGNLDPDLTRDLLLLFADVHRRGTTILLATHDLQIMLAGDRAGLVRAHLTAGRVEVRVPVVVDEEEGDAVLFPLGPLGLPGQVGHMTALRALAYGLARALRGVAGRPLISVLSTGAIGVSLLLVGLVALAATNVARLTARWDDGVQMVVYLEDGVTPERARAIGRVLAAVHAVERVNYVAPDAAYARLAESLGARRDLLEGVETGFLPASLEVRLAGGVRGVAAASPVIERLRRTPGVEEVEFLGDWVNRLSALLGALRAAALALALLVGGACVYVIGGTIKLGMYARRDELEVLRLVGATDGFVRLPLLVEGALQGAVGAGVAIGLLYAVYRLGAPALERMLSSAVGGLELTFFPPPLCALALAAGLGLGIVGSWLAVGRHAEAG